MDITTIYCKQGNIILFVLMLFVLPLPSDAVVFFAIFYFQRSLLLFYFKSFLSSECFSFQLKMSSWLFYKFIVSALLRVEIQKKHRDCRLWSLRLSRLFTLHKSDWFSEFNTFCVIKTFIKEIPRQNHSWVRKT